MKEIFAIIGGSNFDLTAYGDAVDVASPQTPYGDISAPLQIFRRRDRTIAFLPRHGVPHRMAPHCINYRANVWALREFGCSQIVAINTVGGITNNRVGELVLPHQIIDYTHGREHTYSDGSEQPLQHIDFTEPYSAPLRQSLLKAAERAQVKLFDGGVYGATQGPRLESAAEINRMQRDGCDIVGMTGMPEAALARELNIDYAALCVVVNPAAGRGGPISVEAMQQVSRAGMQAVAGILDALLDG